MSAHPLLRELECMAALHPMAATEERIAAGAMRRILARRVWWPAPVAVVVLAAAAALVFLPRGLSPVRGQTYTTRGDALAFDFARHEVNLGAHSEVQFASVDAGHVELVLRRGRVQSHVHKLGDGGAFLVKTDLLVVRVVGTVFAVEREAGCSRVQVSEGRVRVTERATGAEELLLPGQSLRVCRAQVRPEERASIVMPPAESSSPAQSTRALEDHARERAAPGEELVRTALVRLSKDRTSAEAARLLRRYLAEHPRGMFAEDALYHLCLVAVRRGDDDARDLADQFLERFGQSSRAARVKAWATSLIHTP